MASNSFNYNVGINVRANIKEAQAQMAQLQNTLKSIQNESARNLNLSPSLRESALAAGQLADMLKRATNINTGQLDLSKFNAQLQQSNTSLRDLLTRLNNLGTTSAGSKATNQLINMFSQMEVQVQHNTGILQKFAGSLKNTFVWMASSTALRTVYGQIGSAIGYIQDLNKTLTNIRVVTGQSIDQVADFAKQANVAAKSLSTTTKAFADASLIYFQQGDKQADAMKKATITTKAANVAFSASTKEMSEMLTAVWNSYKVGGDQLQEYVDVMAALGAATASSTEEIATAMTKVAATANTVGVSMKQMSSIIATVASVTREAPQSIGTAYKTILARMSDLKMGETLEDGLKLGDVSSSLAKLGVNILDANSNLRDMGTVIDEIGTKWGTLTTAQKTALTQVLAGKRQYTSLMALFENFDKYKFNLGVAEDSKGTLERQNKIYTESYEAAAKRTKASLENLWGSLMNDQGMVKFQNALSKVLDTVTNITKGLGGLPGIFLQLSTILTSAFNAPVITKLTDLAVNLPKTVSYVMNGNLITAHGQVMQGTNSRGERLNQFFLGRVPNQRNIDQAFQFGELADFYNARYKALNSQANLTPSQRKDMQLYEEGRILAEHKRDLALGRLSPTKEGIINAYSQDLAVRQEAQDTYKAALRELGSKETAQKMVDTIIKDYTNAQRQEGGRGNLPPNWNELSEFQKFSRATGWGLTGMQRFHGGQATAADFMQNFILSPIAREQIDITKIISPADLERVIGGVSEANSEQVATLLTEQFGDYFTNLANNYRGNGSSLSLPGYQLSGRETSQGDAAYNLLGQLGFDVSAYENNKEALVGITNHQIMPLVEAVANHNLTPEQARELDNILDQNAILTDRLGNKIGRRADWGDRSGYERAREAIVGSTRQWNEHTNKAADDVIGRIRELWQSANTPSGKQSFLQEIKNPASEAAAALKQVSFGVRAAAQGFSQGAQMANLFADANAGVAAKVTTASTAISSLIASFAMSGNIYVVAAQMAAMAIGAFVQMREQQIKELDESEKKMATLTANNLKNEAKKNTEDINKLYSAQIDLNRANNLWENESISADEYISKLTEIANSLADYRGIVSALSGDYEALAASIQQTIDAEMTRKQLAASETLGQLTANARSIFIAGAQEKNIGFETNWSKWLMNGKEAGDFGRFTNLSVDTKLIQPGEGQTWADIYNNSDLIKFLTQGRNVQYSTKDLENWAGANEEGKNRLPNLIGKSKIETAEDYEKVFKIWAEENFGGDTEAAKNYLLSEDINAIGSALQTFLSLDSENVLKNENYDKFIDALLELADYISSGRMDSNDQVWQLMSSSTAITELMSLAQEVRRSQISAETDYAKTRIHDQLATGSNITNFEGAKSMIDTIIGDSQYLESSVELDDAMIKSLTDLMASYGQTETLLAQQILARQQSRAALIKAYQKQNNTTEQQATEKIDEQLKELATKNEFTDEELTSITDLASLRAAQLDPAEWKKMVSSRSLATRTATANRQWLRAGLDNLEESDFYSNTIIPLLMAMGKKTGEFISAEEFANLDITTQQETIQVALDEANLSFNGWKDAYLNSANNLAELFAGQQKKVLEEEENGYLKDLMQTDKNGNIALGTKEESLSPAEFYAQLRANRTLYQSGDKIEKNTAEQWGKRYGAMQLLGEDVDVSSIENAITLFALFGNLGKRYTATALASLSNEKTASDFSEIFQALNAINSLDPRDWKLEDVKKNLYLLGKSSIDEIANLTDIQRAALKTQALSNTLSEWEAKAAAEKTHKYDQEIAKARLDVETSRVDLNDKIIADYNQQLSNMETQWDRITSAAQSAADAVRSFITNLDELDDLTKVEKLRQDLTAAGLDAAKVEELINDMTNKSKSKESRILAANNAQTLMTLAQIGTIQERQAFTSWDANVAKNAGYIAPNINIDIPKFEKTTSGDIAAGVKSAGTIPVKLEGGSAFGEREDNKFDAAQEQETRRAKILAEAKAAADAHRAEEKAKKAAEYKTAEYNEATETYLPEGVIAALQERNQLIAERDSLLTQIGASDEEIAALNASIAAKNQTILDQSISIEDLDSQIAVQEATIASLTAENESLKAQINDLKAGLKAGENAAANAGLSGEKATEYAKGIARAAVKATSYLGDGVGGWLLSLTSGENEEVYSDWEPPKFDIPKFNMQDWFDKNFGWADDKVWFEGKPFRQFLKDAIFGEGTEIPGAKIFDYIEKSADNQRQILEDAQKITSVDKFRENPELNKIIEDALQAPDEESRNSYIQPYENYVTSNLEQFGIITLSEAKKYWEENIAHANYGTSSYTSEPIDSILVASVVAEETGNTVKQILQGGSAFSENEDRKFEAKVARESIPAVPVTGSQSEADIAERERIKGEQAVRDSAIAEAKEKASQEAVAGEARQSEITQSLVDKWSSVVAGWVETGAEKYRELNGKTADKQEEISRGQAIVDGVNEANRQAQITADKIASLQAEAATHLNNYNNLLNPDDKNVARGQYEYILGELQKWGVETVNEIVRQEHFDKQLNDQIVWEDREDAYFKAESEAALKAKQEEEARLAAQRQVQIEAANRRGEEEARRSGYDPTGTKGVDALLNKLTGGVANAAGSAEGIEGSLESAAASAEQIAEVLSNTAGDTKKGPLLDKIYDNLKENAKNNVTGSKGNYQALKDRGRNAVSQPGMYGVEVYDTMLEQIAGATKGEDGKIQGISQDFAQYFKDTFSEYFDVNASDEFKSIGTNIMLGIVAGMREAGMGDLGISATAEDFASQAFAAFCAACGIASPAERFKYIGQMILMGIKVGFEEMTASPEFNQLSQWEQAWVKASKDIITKANKDMQNDIKDWSEMSDASYEDLQAKWFKEHPDIFTNDTLAQGFAKDADNIFKQMDTQAQAFISQIGTKYFGSLKEAMKAENLEQFSKYIMLEIKLNDTQAQNQMKMLTTQIEQSWVDALSTIYKNEQETAKQVLEIWKSTFDAINTAREAVLNGKNMLQTDEQTRDYMSRNLLDQGLSLSQMGAVMRSRNYAEIQPYFYNAKSLEEAQQLLINSGSVTGQGFIGALEREKGTQLISDNNLTVEGWENYNTVALPKYVHEQIVGPLMKQIGNSITDLDEETLGKMIAPGHSQTPYETALLGILSKKGYISLNEESGLYSRTQKSLTDVDKDLINWDTVEKTIVANNQFNQKDYKEFVRSNYLAQTSNIVEMLDAITKYGESDAKLGGNKKDLDVIDKAIKAKWDQMSGTVDDKARQIFGADNQEDIRRFFKLMGDGEITMKDLFAAQSRVVESGNDLADSFSGTYNAVEKGWATGYRTQLNGQITGVKTLSQADIAQMSNEERALYGIASKEYEKILNETRTKELGASESISEHNGALLKINETGEEYYFINGHYVKRSVVEADSAGVEAFIKANGGINAHLTQDAIKSLSGEVGSDIIDDAYLRDAVNTKLDTLSDTYGKSTDALRIMAESQLAMKGLNWETASAAEQLKALSAVTQTLNNELARDKLFGEQGRAGAFADWQDLQKHPGRYSESEAAQIQADYLNAFNAYLQHAGSEEQILYQRDERGNYLDANGNIVSSKEEAATYQGHANMGGALMTESGGAPQWWTDALAQDSGVVAAMKEYSNSIKQGGEAEEKSREKLVNAINKASDKVLKENQAAAEKEMRGSLGYDSGKKKNFGIAENGPYRHRTGSSGSDVVDKTIDKINDAVDDGNTLNDLFYVDQKGIVQRVEGITDEVANLMSDMLEDPNTFRNKLDAAFDANDPTAMANMAQAVNAMGQALMASGMSADQAAAALSRYTGRAIETVDAAKDVGQAAGEAAEGTEAAQDAASGSGKTVTAHVISMPTGQEAQDAGFDGEITAELPDFGFVPDATFTINDAPVVLDGEIHFKPQGNAVTTIDGHEHKDEMKSEQTAFAIGDKLDVKQDNLSGGGGGKKGGGGGGGGGGSKKKEKHQTYKKNIPRYHRTESHINNTSKDISKLNKIKERTFGKDLLKNMKTEIDYLKEQEKWYKTLLVEAKEWLKFDKDLLNKYFPNIKYDAEGSIKNYTEIMKGIIDEYNRAVDRFNASAQDEDDKNALDDAKNKMQEQQELLNKYEESLAKVHEAQEQILDTQNQMADNYLEQIQTKLQYVTEWDQRERDLLDYINTKYEQVLIKQSGTMHNYITEVQNLNNDLSHMAMTFDELNQAYKNGDIFQAQYIQGLQDLQEQILDTLNSIEEMRVSIKELYGNTLDLWNDKISKNISLIEQQKNTLSSFIDIMKLTDGGESAYAAFQQFYNGSIDVNKQMVRINKQNLDTLEAQLPYYEQQMKLGEVSKENYEALLAHITEARETFLQSVQDTMQAVQDAYINSINALQQELNRSFAGMYDDVAYMQEQFNSFKEIRDQYLTATTQGYEVAKLNRQIDKDLSETESDWFKAQLTQFQEILNAEDKQNKLTQYEIDKLNKQYDVLKAIAELEDARAAKDTVRLTRDENGNFMYQYTADEDKVNDAEQKYDDAVKSLYDLIRDHADEAQQQILDAMQQFSDKYGEILQDMTLTTEQKTKRIQDLIDWASNKLGFWTDDFAETMNDLNNINEIAGEFWNRNGRSLTEEVNGQLGGQLVDFANHITAAQNAVDGGLSALSTYDTDIAKILEEAGINDMTMDLQMQRLNYEANYAIDNINTLDDELTEVSESIRTMATAWDTFNEKLEKTLENMQSMFEMIQGIVKADIGDSSLGEYIDIGAKWSSNIAGNRFGLNLPQKETPFSLADYLAKYTGGGVHDANEDLLRQIWETWLYEDTNLNKIYWNTVVSANSNNGNNNNNNNNGKPPNKPGNTNLQNPEVQGPSTLADVVGQPPVSPPTNPIQQIVDLIRKNGKANGGLNTHTGLDWLDGTLQKPELVLNATDTQRMFDIIDAERSISAPMLSNIVSLIDTLANIQGINSRRFDFNNGEPQAQNITINADFPNVSSRDEIKAAFGDMMNMASQYINSTV